MFLLRSIVPFLLLLLSYAGTAQTVQNDASSGDSVIFLVGIEDHKVVITDVFTFYKWGIIDPVNKTYLTKPQSVYESTDLIHENLSIDSTGKIKICSRQRAVKCENGLAIVEINKKYGIIDTTGKFIVEPQWDIIRDFSNGFATIEIGNFWSSKVGVIDRTGKIVVEPQFDYIGDFSQGGVARVQLNGAWGYIDTTGKYIVEPLFFDAEDFSKYDVGVVSVIIDTSRYHMYGDAARGIIDKTGTFVVEPDEYESILRTNDGGYFIVMDDNGRYGYLNQYGREMIKPQFLHARHFFEGLAVVEKERRDISGGKWGYIDTTWNFVIEPRFDYVLDFSNGFAAAMIDGKWGFIDKTGNFVIEPRFDKVMSFHNGLAAVRVDRKWGFIDETGNLVIEPQFDEEAAFYHDNYNYCIVSLNGKLGVIDKTGKFVIEPVFDKIMITFRSHLISNDYIPHNED